MKKILVIGGAGFVGSHLVEELCKNNKFKISVVDNLFLGSKKNLKKVLNKINFFQIDVTHLGGFPEAIKVLNYMENFYPKTKFSSHLWGSGLSGLLNLALCRASESIIWFEVPLLEFDINKHIFKEKELDFSNISNDEIDSYLGDLNLDRNSNYDFIENSGYKI